MSKFLKYMLGGCALILFWITPSLIDGNSFESSLKELVYSIGFLVIVGVVLYIFYETVVKKDQMRK